MKVLYVVQRYGAEVGGGAEAATRSLAEALAGRGHEVGVLTSCALNYDTWEDHYEPGVSELNGVEVERLRVARPRENSRFGPLHAGVFTRRGPLPLHLQRHWAHEHGPDLAGFGSELRLRSAAVDVVGFYSYLFAPAVFGLPIAASQAPVVFHPAAHDEDILGLALFDTVFRQADGTFLHTPEEGALLARRFGPSVVSRASVIGLGIDPAPAADSAAFRRRYALGDTPYLLLLGRTDPGKGVGEALDFYAAYRARSGAPPRLVIVGARVAEYPETDGVTWTGYLDEPDKHAALAGAWALLQPSFFESFSLVLLEAFSHGVPALVQGANPVLVGQANRSRAAIAYRGFARFEATLDELAARPQLRDAMGAAGRRFVEHEYAWPVVIDRYERFLATSITRGRRRLGRGPATS